MTVRSVVVSALKRTHLIGVARRVREIASPSSWHQQKRMRQFYAQFVKSGDLVIDVGANVGNRSAVFLELGARVIAVEPQQACAATLRKRFGSDPQFTLVTDALAASEGEGELMIADESTVSSMATDWIERVKETGRFGEVDWSKRQKVHTTTLDALIAKAGLPSFCKIDVEGFEATVLQGLSLRIPAVSFEFTPEFLQSAVSSIEHLASIGHERFNFSFGESMSLELPQWVGKEEILRRLHAAPHNTFGDVYAS